ncbi:MAG: TIGR02099 family protein [Pseudomonas sp.]|nr:TIGR02099 family protein [Pseudomonas sp.]
MKGAAGLLGGLLHRLFGVTAGLLVLAALYVALGRQLVPLVAEYRQEVEARVEQAIGMPVAIGRLEGAWQGFAPQMLAHDVVLGEGAAAVRLDRLILVPDIAESLLARQPILRSLTLVGLHLGLVEGRDGGWAVKGLPQRSQGPVPDIERILRGLQAVHLLALEDSQVTFEPAGGPVATLSYVALALRSSADDWRLDGRTVLPDGQTLSLALRARGKASAWREAEADLYLSLPQSDWAAWLPKRSVGDWQLQALQAGGELWARWERGGLARAAARLNAAHLVAGYQARASVVLDDLAADLYVDRQAGGDYRLQAERLSFDLGEQRLAETRLVVQRGAASGDWALRIDRLQVAPLAALAQALAPLPEAGLETLNALAPQGMLQDVRVAFRPGRSDEERLRYSARLDDIRIGDHHWIPAVEHASGTVSGTQYRGQLRLDSRDFSLQLAPLFPEAWAYRQARGTLSWRLDEEALTLVGSALQLEGEEGRLAGDFLIRLRRDPAAEDYMDLRVGLSDGDARFAGKYLPSRSPALSPALKDWLEQAIRGGTIEQGYFLYQGALNRGAPAEARSMGLYFKVHDAELAYRPGWPALRGGRGEVLIEDSGIRVRLAEGQILDSQVRDVRASIPREVDGPLQLAIQGAVTSSVADALTLLRDAPMGTQALFAGWQGEGRLEGQLDLQIPLAQGGKPRVAVDFHSEEARLSIPQPALAFDQLSGSFRYDSERGFSAERFSAQAFGRSVRGRAVATGSSGAPSTRIEAQGSIALERLAQWLGIEQPLPISGELPYQLRLGLDGADSLLQIDSSLLGASIDLPAPFGKAAGVRRDTSLRMTLQGPERRYSVRHGELAALNFAAPAEDWRQGRGELRLGPGAAVLPSRSGLRVRGRLDQLELQAWQAARERYLADAGGAAPAGGLLRGAELRIERFQGFGTDIAGLDVDLQRLTGAWSLGLRSDTISGRLELPDAPGATLTADLQQLRLPAASPQADGGDRPDPLAAVDPGSLPPMDIRIAQVWQGDARLGPWALKLRPRESGVTFSDVDLELKGLKLQGSGSWAAGRTRYQGRLSGSNLADVLLAWGFAPSTTSESFRLDVDGSWPGSPAWFALSRYSGTLEPRLRKGQFVELEGGTQALRVFGLLNFNSIGRRLRLDFSDLFGKGYSYDRLTGSLVARDGVYRTEKAVTVSGPSSNLELSGTLDMVADRIDAKLLVTLPVSNNLPLAALIVGAPAVGGALFVFDKLLGDRVARFASVQYNVEGPWQSPRITFDKPFEKPE